MTIETRTLSIALDREGLHLIEALKHFARSRATRALIRKSLDRDVRCDLRVPFVDQCNVDPRALGRALRKLMGETIENGSPGDRALVDFLMSDSGTLTIKAGDYRDANIRPPW